MPDYRLSTKNILITWHQLHVCHYDTELNDHKYDKFYEDVKNHDDDNDHENDNGHENDDFAENEKNAAIVNLRELDDHRCRRGWL